VAEEPGEVEVKRAENREGGSTLRACWGAAPRAAACAYVASGHS
jgi:hypothetical protein